MKKKMKIVEKEEQIEEAKVQSHSLLQERKRRIVGDDFLSANNAIPK